MTATNRFESDDDGAARTPHHLSAVSLPEMFDAPAAWPHSQLAGA
jgi:hypothetical protein